MSRLDYHDHGETLGKQSTEAGVLSHGARAVNPSSSVHLSVRGFSAFDTRLESLRQRGTSIKRLTPLSLVIWT